MLTQKIERSWSQGCTDVCQIFDFKATTSECCLSPLCGGSSTFALIIKKKKKSRGSLELTLLFVVIAEKFQLGRVLLCLFVYVFDWNGARIRRNFQDFSKSTMSGVPETLELNTNLIKFTKVITHFFFRNVFFSSTTTTTTDLYGQVWFGLKSTNIPSRRLLWPDSFNKAGWPHTNCCCLDPPERTALSAHTGTS